MSFVPCISWVRRGVANKEPVQAEISEEELRRLCEERSESEQEDDEKEAKPESTTEQAANSDDELAIYNLDTYDESDPEEDGDSDEEAAGKEQDLSFDDESDVENFLIQPDDNLLVVGRVTKEAYILEVHVYNHDEDDFYCHHDYLLPAVPLCIESVQYERGGEYGANLAAVGSLHNQITVWDLDIVDSLEPAFTLGKLKELKSGADNSVLCLSWNKHIRNAIAAGSADCRVRLWDLSTLKAVTKLKLFTDKVQSMQWHPFESQTLLAGSCDKTVRLFDCRDPSGSSKVWEMEGEVEQVLWNHFDPYCCLASTDNGQVVYLDPRMDSAVWRLNAHNDACIGLCLSPQCPGLLVTASEDRTMKVWDILGNKPAFILEKNLNIGTVFGLAMNPDLPYVTAACGENGSQNLRLDDLCRSAAVSSCFGERELLRPLLSSVDSMEEPTGKGADGEHKRKKSKKKKPKTESAGKESVQNEGATEGKKKRKKKKNKNSTGTLNTEEGAGMKFARNEDRTRGDVSHISTQGTSKKNSNQSNQTSINTSKFELKVKRNQKIKKAKSKKLKT